MEIGRLLHAAIELLGRIHEDTQSPEERELLLAATDALRFINTTGQQYALEDYRKDLESEGPEQVIAAFETREEAETWLKDNPSPPHMAAVLVADEYHAVYYSRERNLRGMLYSPTLEHYLQRLMRDGLPPAVATFQTRQEAKAWFEGLTERPAQVIIQLGDERYLMAYHRNIGHLAFHPFSIVQRLEERRKEREEQKGGEEPEQEH